MIFFDYLLKYWYIRNGGKEKHTSTKLNSIVTKDVVHRMFII